ncbi:hypothetical protein [Levilactobacillus suantsaii]|uniref:WxL domain-containing protein n=1 Tax=Levilactobacillus suantsaii TaxID=2292255 RepID=A0A4Q0VLK8_9LACO|nr:hypothetical protein [Levilactobacillus suantsaii]QMU07628.1 hypothetical protein H3M12_09150 [Levilactobacillus suantsaii]RXI79546.1 hypothetical protein DXH47_02140 [Levilactobacillus suantsaii]
MMIKKQLFSALAVAGLVLPLGFAVTPALAATGDTTTTAPQTATGKATVAVTPGTLAFATDNGKAVVPSFDFNVGLDSLDKAVPAANSGDLKIDNFLGDGSSWSLTATLGQFNTVNKDQKPQGTLEFDSSALSKTDATDKLKTTQETLASPTTATEKVAPKTLFSAPQNDEDGMGTLSMTLQPKLTNFSGVDRTGTYTADLTYTLTSGPQKQS